MLENSDDFSDELDEFEESQDDTNLKKKVWFLLEDICIDQSILSEMWSCNRRDLIIDCVLLHPERD